MAEIKIIGDYKNALQAIYDHVGLVEDYVVCPIDDKTEMFWRVDESNVYYAETEEDLKNLTGNHYEDGIYTQRFYKKWVYRGEQFTLVFCDPHTDGMKWWRLFDNNKERV